MFSKRVKAILDALASTLTLSKRSKLFIFADAFHLLLTRASAATSPTSCVALLPAHYLPGQFCGSNGPDRPQVTEGQRLNPEENSSRIHGALLS
jgi:hypothetical protein